MSITFTGTGGLHTRLGRMGGCLNNVNGFLGTSAPASATTWGSGGPSIACLATNINNIEAQFQSSRQDLVDLLYSQRDAFRRAPSGLKSYLQQLAQKTAIGMADDDVHLTSKTLALALATIISQMASGAYYVGNPTVTATSTAGASNNGDGVCPVSLVGPDGVTRYNVFAETIDVTCSADSQSSAASLSIEPFIVAGDAANSDPLAWDWPGGSGASTGFNAINAASTSSSLLDNGDFEDFTVANTPDDWTIAVGTAGTDIFKESSTVYSGSYALKYTGTGGSPLSEIYQDVTLKPNTVYAFACWLRKSASLAAGVLQIDLHDGSAVIQNDAATDNKATKTLSTLSSSAWTSFTGFFQTPKLLPATTRLRLKATTALTSGESMYLDRLAFVEVSELYKGGPFARVFSGATKFLKNDTFALAVANDYAGKWHVLGERLFGLRSLGLQWPSSGSNLIADTLIA